MSIIEWIIVIAVISIILRGVVEMILYRFPPKKMKENEETYCPDCDNWHSGRDRCSTVQWELEKPVRKTKVEEVTAEVVK